VAALGFAAVTAVAQTVPLEDLATDHVVRKFTLEDGLPQNSITKIVQTPDGYLWCSTYRGLVRFDGVRFTVFDSGNTKAITGDDTVEALHRDHRGRLAVVMKGGELLWVDQGRITRGNGTAGLPDGPLGMRGESPDGGLNLVALDSSTWYRETASGLFARGEPPRDVAPRSFDDVVVDSDGTVWGRDGDASSRIDPKDLRPLLPAAEPAATAVRIVGRSRRGGLWVVTDRGFHLWEEHGWKKHIPAPEPFGGCAGILEDSAGDLWLATWSQGLWRLEPEGRFHHHQFGRSARPEAVRALFEDAERNLWVGTEASGLCRLSHRGFRTVGAADGLAGEIVRSVTEDSTGSIWVATQAGVESFLPGHRPAPALQFATDFPWCIHHDSTGKIWVGSYGGGVFMREGNRTVTVEPNSSEDRRTITLFFEEPGQGLWVGRENGLWRVSGTGLVREPLPAEVSGYAVRAMTLDGRSRLWLGLAGAGLLCRESGRWIRVPIPGALPSLSVATLLAGPEDTLWIGTSGRGYFRLRQGIFAKLEPEQIGLPRWPSSMVEDGAGSIWIGSGDGIFRVSRAGLNAWADGRRTDLLPRRFAREDGLETTECSVNIQPVMYRASDQRLWFATSKGVSVVDPARLRPNPVPPPTVIEDVLVDGVPLFSNGPSATGPAEIPTGDLEVVVPAGRQRVEIRYTGLSLMAPERVRFRHRLDGAETEWEEAGTRRTATYHRPSPGHHRFQVLAANNDGVWASRGAELRLRVLPAWWQTWPFQAGVTLSLTAAAFGAYRARIRTVTRARIVQEEFSRRLIGSQEAERRRIARELHDSLGQNLLVIKCRMALAQQQAGQPEKAAEQLRQAAEMTSQTIREVRAISQNLRPFQLDELGLTKAIAANVQELAATTPIRFTVDLADLRGALPPEQEIDLFRIVQECLNNVLKHSRAAHCSVSAMREDGQLRVEVADDGRGFEPAAGGPERNGDRLPNNREAGGDPGGQVVFSSRPGEGTRITVTVALRT